MNQAIRGQRGKTTTVEWSGCGFCTQDGGRMIVDHVQTFDANATAGRLDWSQNSWERFTACVFGILWLQMEWMGHQGGLAKG